MDEKSKLCAEKQTFKHLQFTWEIFWHNQKRHNNKMDPVFFKFIPDTFLSFFHYSQHFSRQFQWVDIIIIHALVKCIVYLSTLVKLDDLKRGKGQEKKERGVKKNRAMEECKVL